MNTEKLEQLKSTKAYQKSDLIVYVAIACLIVALFFVFFSGTSDSALSGVRFETGSGAKTTILSYSFSDDKIVIADGYAEKVSIEKADNGYYVTVLTENGEYNKAFIDKAAREVVMVDADCSYHKDCVLFTAIKRGGDTIICVPHGLFIVGTGEIRDDEPQIGGNA